MSGRAAGPAWWGGAVATAVAAPLAFPGALLGLDGFGLLAPLTAVRPHLVAMVFLTGCVVTGLAATGRRRRRWWPAAAGLVTVALAAAVVIAPRVITDPPVPAPGRELTVLSFNTYEGRADVAALAALISRERPDLVALPEAGDRFRTRLAPLVAPLGYRLWSSTPAGVPDVDGVTALAAAPLGAVTGRADPATARPSLELSGGGLGPLRFVAFHSIAPVNGGPPRWRADLRRLPHWCASPAPAIVAGDFNATLDHSPFRAGTRGCTDAAAHLGDGLVPTWSSLRALRDVSVQIDHVLATRGIAPETFQVLDLPGSDHRALLSRLRVPAGRPPA